MKNKKRPHCQLINVNHSLTFVSFVTYPGNNEKESHRTGDMWSLNTGKINIKYTTMLNKIKVT